MKQKYSNVNEAFEIYSKRKSLKIQKNKVDKKALSKREFRLMRFAFLAGWEYFKWKEGERQETKG